VTSRGVPNNRPGHPLPAMIAWTLSEARFRAVIRNLLTPSHLA
jgi:hypothetical protein